MKIVDRYLLRQMGGPFVFGVLAFVIFFVSADVLFDLMKLINELGLTLWTAALLFLLRMPEFVVYTFPLATLVAILIAFGRLSGDSELVAMFAGGISFRRLVIPLIGAGFLISVSTAALNELVVPVCNHRAENIVRAATKRTSALGRENVFYEQMSADQLTCTVFARRLDGSTGEMLFPTITWFEQGRPVMLTRAESGRWSQTSWQMLNGVNFLLDPDRPASVSFDRWTTELAVTPAQMLQQGREPDEMTYRELQASIEHARRNRIPAADLELALHHKFSIPFACLVFALVAPPLGMRSHRGSSSIGMGIALIIGFAYYVVYSYLAALADQGHLAPVLAAWLPNVVTGAVGVGLILNVRR